MSSRIAVIFVAFVALAFGCSSSPGTTRPQVSDQEAEREFDEVAASMLARHVAAKRRLVDMEFAFTTYAARYCANVTRPNFGIFLSHDEAFADERWQRVSRRELELSESPTVIHLVPGGPAERAGLLPGDVILSLDGVAMTSGPEVILHLLKEKIGSQVRTRYRRGEQEFEVDVAPVPACPIRLSINGSHALFPLQTEKLVVLIPIGLVRFYPDSDDELAVAVGHQLAHALFDRSEDDDLTREERADRFGLVLTSGAGYDVSAARGYWEAVARTHPFLIGEPKPIGGKRLAPLHAYLAERMASIDERVLIIEEQMGGKPAQPAD